MEVGRAFTPLLVLACPLLETLLNQANAGLWPVRTWFLKIDPVQIVSMHVCVCVCVSAPKAINN